jgi:hypothetical protein
MPEHARSRWDLHLWLIVLVAACVVIPRAGLILREHNETVDDDFHLRRGLLFWTRPAGVSVTMSNPPLGGAIAALPMWLLGCDSTGEINPDTVAPADIAPASLQPGAESTDTPPDRRARARAGRINVLYGQPLPPQTLLLIIGLWKALLYVPFVTIAFAWCRALYGTASGWMVSLLLIFEPNLAAYIHSASMDVIGVEAVFIACFTVWRYAQAPSTRRLVVAAVVTAFAMLVKHLAMILPLVIVAYLVADALARRTPLRGPGVWRPRVRSAALAVLVWAISLWAFTGFDVSVPYDVGGSAPWSTDKPWKRALVDVVDANLTRPLPAGQYIGSTFYLLRLNAGGQWSYLFGEHRLRGWWYYFPAVATYKVPLGVAVVFVVAIGSLTWRKPTVAELGLLIPFLAYGAVCLRTQLNIGFRHAFPAYVFALALASRAVAPEVVRWLRMTAWAGVAATAVHGLTFHPNYHTYLNIPRSHVYLDINDSNVDWGQCIRAIPKWLDEHADLVGDRPVYIRAFGDDQGAAQGWYVGRRARRLALGDPRPTSGLLIISPIHVVGLYDMEQSYEALASCEPHAVIADTMLVYDLDQLAARGFVWPAPVKGNNPFTDPS